MPRHVLRGIVGCLVVLPWFLAGCSSHHRVSPLSLPVATTRRAPDPALASGRQDLLVDSLLYSGLVQFGPDLHVIPNLAVAIPTVAHGGRTYTFTLRSDVRFADGTRVTARDVAYSIIRALHIGSPVARRCLGQIAGADAVERGQTLHASGIRAVGRLSLRLTLVQPDAQFLEGLALPVSWVVDPRHVSLYPMRAWPHAPVGTGPFVFAASQPNGTIDLRPRPHDGNGATLSAVSLVPTRHPLAAYRAGRIDATPVSVLDTRASLLPDFHQSPSLTGYYLVPQGGNAVAVAARVNRHRLTRHTLLTPMASIVPPAVPDYTGNSLPLTGSRAHLPIRIRSEAQGTTGAILLRGLDAQFGNLPQSSTPRTRVLLLSHSSLLPDPPEWLALVHTASPWFAATMARAARLTNDPVTRMTLYGQAEEWALQRGLIVPLADGDMAYLIKPRVQGLDVTPLGLMPDSGSWSSVSVS